jgi:peptidoglycan hydrolase-like protein with peptidoglycan-binding domain
MEVEHLPITLPRFVNVKQVSLAAANNPPLMQGARGDGVRELQLALIELGFAMPRSTKGGTELPDGIFGSETKATVEAFQRANLLKADGIAGARTFDRLNGLIAAQSGARAAAESRPPARRAFV